MVNYFYGYEYLVVFLRAVPNGCMIIPKYTFCLSVLYVLVDLARYDKEFDEDDINIIYDAKYSKSRIKRGDALDDRPRPNERKPPIMAPYIKLPNFLRPRKTDISDQAVNKEIGYLSNFSSPASSTVSESIEANFTGILEKTEVLTDQDSGSKPSIKEFTEKDDRNLTQIYLDGKSEFDVFDNLPLHKIYSMSFSERVVQSNATLCRICPETFLVSFPQTCRDLLGIVPTNKGFARIFTYNLDYSARCENGSEITGADLEQLAHIEVNRINEVSNKDPFLSSLLNVTIFQTPIKSKFTLSYTILSNDLVILDVLLAQIKLIASVDVNITKCTALYSVDDRFQDIDECQLGLDTCTKEKICINTIGSFLCACPQGKVASLDKQCACVKVQTLPVPGTVTLSFVGRSFLIPIPPYTDYKVSAIIMIIIFAILAIANLTVYFRIC